MSKPTKLLLVEDNERVRTTLRHAFRGIPGMRVVHEAVTTAQACDWLEQNAGNWDIAVVDIFLAKGHGFDVLRCCAERHPGQKVVVLSNYTREPVRSSAERLGADAVFDKSLEMEEFMDWCRELATSERAN